MDEAGGGRPVDVAAVGEFLVRLGGAMTVSGESVDQVRARLHAMALTYGIGEVEVLVLPTVIFVETGSGSTAQVHMGSISLRRQPRLDQVAALYDLVHRVERGEVAAAVGMGELATLLDDPPPHGRVVRVIGYGVLSVGFSLLLQPSWIGVLASLVLGCVVGVLTVVGLATLRTILPVLAAFLVSMLVFGLADYVEGENPIRVLIPPLVAFLPGAVLTTGTVELAAGQVMSGASRLVQGVVMLALLAFGIVAAGALVDVPAASLIDRPHERLGAWAPWAGIVLVAAGDHLHYCAPRRLMPYVVAVLTVAYVGQQFGAAVFSAQLSGFFGALAMTPLVLWLSHRRDGPPSMVTFLPGFWLLVPGAAGLIGITEIVGTTSSLGPADFSAALVTVMSIALGVLIGTAAYNSAVASVRTMAELPDHVIRWRRTE